MTVTVLFLSMPLYQECITLLIILIHKIIYREGKNWTRGGGYPHSPRCMTPRLASHSLFSDWTRAGEKRLVTLGYSLCKSGMLWNANDSTAGADASVEALKLYHMLSLLALLIVLVARIVQKMGNDRPWSLLKKFQVHKINGRGRLIKVMAAAEQKYSFAALLSLLQLPIATVLVQS